MKEFQYFDPVESVVGQEIKIKLGLERIERMLELLGNPEKKFKAIHIAGTNGKGSTAAMVASILQQAGFKIGLYTSPHLAKVNERIKINSQDIDDGTLAKEIEAMKKLIVENKIDATYYEFITAIAFKYFAEQRVDFVVAEVGLGGRLDATNVLPAPLVCAITNVGLEHQEFLGETLEEIAREKIAIIKENRFVVTSVKEENLIELIKEKCMEKNAGLFHIADYGPKVIERNIGFQKIELKNEKFKLALLGDFQLDNAALALGCVEGLRQQGIEVSDEAVRQGFEKVQFPGRFEVVKKEPLLVLDSAHNPPGIKILAESLQAYFPGKKFLLVFGASKGRDLEAMLESLKAVSDDVLACSSGHAKAVEPGLIAEKALAVGFKNVEVKENAKAALGKALKEDKPVCVCGSVYLIGKVRKLLI